MKAQRHKWRPTRPSPRHIHKSRLCLVWRNKNQLASIVFSPLTATAKHTHHHHPHNALARTKNNTPPPLLSPRHPHADTHTHTRTFRLPRYIVRCVAPARRRPDAQKREREKRVKHSRDCSLLLSSRLFPHPPALFPLHQTQTPTPRRHRTIHPHRILCRGPPTTPACLRLSRAPPPILRPSLSHARLCPFSRVKAEDTRTRRSPHSASIAPPRAPSRVAARDTERDKSTARARPRHRLPPPPSPASLPLSPLPNKRKGSAPPPPFLNAHTRPIALTLTQRL